MANWASTDYVIEGPRETLKKIYDAIQHPVVEPGSDEKWEGNVLNTLGIEWKTRQPDGSGYYMRGFIQDKECIEFNPEKDDTLSFYAEEAWGVTDFNEVLETTFPDIKVYFNVIEEGCEIYATNDKDGKYFPYRWHVEACINGNYLYEDFTAEKAMYDWLSDNTEGKVIDDESAEKFNNDYEKLGTEDDNYIFIHEFEICE
jgi:hypothetical protein